MPAQKHKKTTNTVETDDDSESDTSIPAKQVPTKNWSVPESTQLCHAILSPNGPYWLKWNKNPTRVYKLISKKIFNNKCNPTARKGSFQRLYQCYKHILKLKEWMGNDCDDPDLNVHIENAQKASVALPSKFSEKTILDFKQDGYYA
ncbi:hypothetical protein NLJ89_g11534 [Agrocybe chaxingu]|uniref:Uncharacterized protein n=1 Tax=Agrocybe chaxingu TaxID=84603 RepID=A0A9W8MMY2_9AGAR|nr:hypothetical protein NLJ89_g11534 [Agrocybe chaxingu]